MESSSQDEAMTDVFTGRSVVAFGEGVDGIADAVYVIKEFAKNATPGFGASESVICDKIEAPREVTLQVQGETLIGGTIVRSKNCQIGYKLLLRLGIWREKG